VLPTLTNTRVDIMMLPAVHLAYIPRGLQVPRAENKAPDRLRSLIPPPNFGAVVPGSVYRSSYPQAENFEFLKSLGLKSIL
jgi:tyrosine-protein phosphatase SIW14